MSQEGTAPLPPPPQETKAAVADDGSPYSCAPSSVSNKDDGEARGPAPVIATATATASSSSDAVIAGSLEQASAATGAASIKVLTSTGAHTTTFVSSNDASSPSPTEPPCAAAGLPKNEENGDTPLNSNERTSLGHEPEGRTSSAGATVEGRGQGGGASPSLMAPNISQNLQRKSESGDTAAQREQDEGGGSVAADADVAAHHQSQRRQQSGGALRSLWCQTWQR